MIKHFCDRCGDEIPKGEQRFYVLPKDQDGDTPIGMKPETELCPKCKQELKEFLVGESTGTGDSCEFCRDLDYLSGIVCYIPDEDTGGAVFVPVNYCPKCGRKIGDE